MLVIAERINATRERIARAMKERDEDHIARETHLQDGCGADFIDVNAGSDPSKEIENLCWAVEVVQKNTDKPLCIDSAGAEGFRAALEVLEGDEVMLNSVNGEEEKLEEIFPIAAECNAKLVGLLMDDRGLPTTVDQRLEISERIIEEADKYDIGVDRLYLDPCVQPLSTSPDQSQAVTHSVERIMEEFPGIHTTGGLSNISFGLPYRSIINRVFLGILIEHGLDAAIIDPTEGDMMATVHAAEAVSGKDDFCMNYIQADRNGLLRPHEGSESA